MMLDQLGPWDRACRQVRDWAARNGLLVMGASDASIEPEFDRDFLNVVADPRPDLSGFTFARPTVLTLRRRYLVGLDGARLIGFEAIIEVALVRHGRGSRDPVIISPDDLRRFGLEARHLDRID